ncbi:Spy/CpxP family protein refolding chaperone [Sorangium sp. So ce131]|uniref:Spy/CpxP family protein refolding chaperone n=1 Tax=Sorangium sp. So ce131 TaxID=3133282 RepID=UPI003F609370
MLGFVIGTACLIGLIMALRRGRYACGAPWAAEPHPFRRRGFGGFGGFGFRRRFFLSFLFDRLDTTPAQEKVIVSALDELRAAADAQRGELRGTRADVAAALRSPSLDETRLGELFARHDTAIEALRKAAVGALGKVHAVLEDRQREELADLVEIGPAAFRGGWSGRARGRGRYADPYRTRGHWA